MEEVYLWLGKYVYWLMFPLMAFQNVLSYQKEQKRIYLHGIGLCILMFLLLVYKQWRKYGLTL